MWNFLFKKSSPLHLNVQLDITNACNLNCKHCYHSDHLNSGAMSVADWLRAFEKVKEFCTELSASPIFVLCGGEPTLAPNFSEMLKEIRANFPKAPIQVLTNGTTLKKPLPCGKSILDLIDWANAEVQISLDGASAQSHDLIRGRGNFDRAVEGVRLLRTRNIPVTIQAVLSTSTAREIHDFFALASSLNAQNMNFVRLVEEGMAVKYVKSFGAEHSPHLLGRHLEDAFRSILAASEQFSVATNTSGPLWALVDERLGSASRLGFYDLIIDYRGHIKVSSRTPTQLGKILAEPVWEILQDPVLRALRAGNIEGCGECEVFKRGKCSGDRNISFASSGSFLGPDVGCWKWRELNGHDKENDLHHYASNGSASGDGLVLQEEIHV